MPGQGVRRRDPQPYLRPQLLRHRGELQGAALGLPIPLRPRHRRVGQVLRVAQGVHHEQVSMIGFLTNLADALPLFRITIIKLFKGVALSFGVTDILFKGVTVLWDTQI